MARDFFINAESLVYVKGNTSTNIASLTQFGLPSEPIRVSPQFKHRDIKVNAWGEAPPEIQFMLAWVDIRMNLVHFDRAIMDTCITECMAGAPAIGQTPRAGARMGNGLARFQSVGPAQNQSNHFIGLNIASPVGNKPWRFYSAYLVTWDFPLGAEASDVTMQWRAVPYPVTSTPPGDPANIQGGVILGAQGNIIWDHTLDT